MDERKTNPELQMAFSHTLRGLLQEFFLAFSMQNAQPEETLSATSSDLSNHAGHRNFLIDLSSELVKKKKKASPPYSETSSDGDFTL